MIKQIVTKEEKQLFRQAIKEELKKVFSNVEDDIYDYSFFLYNTKDKYCCMLQKDFTNFQVRMFVVMHEVDPIIIGELYDFRIELNKNTTDRELDKFANKIIKEYNERVRQRKLEEWWNKLYEKGMIEEEEDGGWHYTDKYYEKHRR